MTDNNNDSNHDHDHNRSNSLNSNQQPTNQPPPIPNQHEQDSIHQAYQANSTQGYQTSQVAANPYAAPDLHSMQSYPQLSNEIALLSEARKCESGRGVLWFSHAFNTLKENLAFLAVCGLIMFVIYVSGNLIPGLSLLLGLFAFHFTGSFMIIFRKIHQGEQVAYSDIVSAFQNHIGPLFILFLLIMAMSLVALIPAIIMAAVVFGSLIANMDTSADFETAIFEALMNFNGGTFSMLAIGVLLMLTIMIPIMMASYLAPAFVVLHDIKPTKALSMSFKACMKNMLPFTLLGLIMMVVFPVLILCTLGLGMIITTPLGYAIKYNCYRDIWTNNMIEE